MHKRLAIVQSCYIPWKGYFDLIHSVDEFILYDEVQYTPRDWRNRIKTRDGALWLTIPVLTKSKTHQAIRDVTVSDGSWSARHWNSILHAYSKAPCFAEARAVLEPLFAPGGTKRLSEINRSFLEAICRYLGVETPIRWSWDYRTDRRLGKTERLIDLCRQAHADVYLSGPSAREYIDAGLFKQAGIGLEFYEYDGYPEYRQMHPPFVHEVSIVDLLCNEGSAAPRFMKSFCRGRV